MKLIYNCDLCGDLIDVLEMAELDEKKLGFDCLNEEERKELLNYDNLTNTMMIKSICDNCINDYALDSDVKRVIN